MARKGQNAFVSLMGSFEGDKVVLMTALLLIVASILALSSSTSLLAVQEHTTRGAIMSEQIKVAIAGIVLIFLCYQVKNVKWFRAIAQLGFLLSFSLLVLLNLHLNLGFVKALYINHAYRSLLFFGHIPVHVFEFSKLFMILYISWAVDTYKKDGFEFANALSKTKWFKFMGTDLAKKAIYIYIPILLVCALVVPGSMSSAMFIGLVLAATTLVGGIQVKEFFWLLLAGVILLSGAIVVHKMLGEKDTSHIGSALDRIGRNPEKELAEAKGTADFQDVVDRVRQPISAKIAVKEGKFFGKGAGKSTQKYVVPVMFEDYMFAFIIEEYGLFGAIIVMFLYCSLVQRGSLIARNCNDVFSKTVVAGLVMLISGQAVLHMIVNVDLGPLTGQSLPMISHGTTSFVIFSLAFGVILSISRMARNKVARDISAEPPIIQHDEVYEGLSDLEEMENE